jgi:D-3-phosphoglycerate dehydrogenase
MATEISVSSTPVAVNNATADVGIFLMIGALRQAYVPLTAIREGMSSVQLNE